MSIQRGRYFFLLCMVAIMVATMILTISCDKSPTNPNNFSYLDQNSSLLSQDEFAYHQQIVDPKSFLQKETINTPLLETSSQTLLEKASLKQLSSVFGLPPHTWVGLISPLEQFAFILPRVILLKPNIAFPNSSIVWGRFKPRYKNYQMPYLYYYHNPHDFKGFENYIGTTCEKMIENALPFPVYKAFLAQSLRLLQKDYETYVKNPSNTPPRDKQVQAGLGILRNSYIAAALFGGLYTNEVFQVCSGIKNFFIHINDEESNNDASPNPILGVSTKEVASMLDKLAKLPWLEKKFKNTILTLIDIKVYPTQP